MDRTCYLPPLPPSTQFDAQAMQDYAIAALAGRWLPIATAPRDGTPVDLWHKEGFREIETWWDAEDQCWSCCRGDNEFLFWQPIITPDGTLLVAVAQEAP